jgi:hypothetical protein
LWPLLFCVRWLVVQLNQWHSQTISSRILLPRPTHTFLERQDFAFSRPPYLNHLLQNFARVDCLATSMDRNIVSSRNPCCDCSGNNGRVWIVEFTDYGESRNSHLFESCYGQWMSWQEADHRRISRLDTRPIGNDPAYF